MKNKENAKEAEWTSNKNLEAHYRKRVEDQRGCFESAIEVPVPMSIEQYDERRKKVCRDPDMVYRCNQWNHRDKSWYGSKLYKVDQDLILVILNPEGDKVITCYHKHPSTMRCPGGTREEQPGANLLELRRDLENLWMTTPDVKKLKFVKPRS